MSAPRPPLRHVLFPGRFLLRITDCNNRISRCHQTAGPPPAAAKAQTREAGVDVKESGFLSGATTWKTGDSHLKAHLPCQWGWRFL